jgi:hypothetical protein
MLKLVNPTLAPAIKAKVWLHKPNKTIYQGKTNDLGKITIVGASDGDWITAESLGIGLQTYSAQVPCSSALNQPLNTASDWIGVLQDAPFSLNTSFVPGGLSNQVIAELSASTTISDTPQLAIYQSGSVTPTIVQMIPAAGNSYTGSFTLETSFFPVGVVDMLAEDMVGHQVRWLSDFGLHDVAASAGAFVFSNDGQAEIYIPADGLSDDTTLSIASTSSSGAPPDNKVVVSGPYNVQSGDSAVRIYTTTLTLKYPDAFGVQGRADLSSIQIYRWDQPTAQWLPLSSNIFDGRNEVATSLSEFGIYAAIGDRQYLVYLPLVQKK